MDKLKKIIAEIKYTIKNSENGKMIGLGAIMFVLVLLYGITSWNSTNQNNSLGDIETNMIAGKDNTKFSDKEKQVKQYIQDDFEREKKNKYFIKTDYLMDDTDKRKFNSMNGKDKESKLVEDIGLKEDLIESILKCNDKCTKNPIDKDKLFELSNEELQKLLNKCEKLQNTCLKSKKSQYIDLFKDCVEKCGSPCKKSSIDMENLDFYSSNELKGFYKDCLNKQGIDYKQKLINDVLDCVKGCMECRMKGIDYDNLEQYSTEKLEQILDYCKNVKKHYLINSILDCIDGCMKCRMDGIDYDNLEQYSIKKLKEILDYCKNHKLKQKLINDILDCIDGCMKCRMDGIDYDNLEQYSVAKLKEILDYCKNKKGNFDKKGLINDILNCIDGCMQCRMDGIDYDNLEQYSYTKLQEILDYCKDHNKRDLINDVLDCLKTCDSCKYKNATFDELKMFSKEKLKEILRNCKNKKLKQKLINDILNCIDGCMQCRMDGIDYDNLEQYSVAKLKEILDYCKNYKKKGKLINDILDCIAGCDKCHMTGIDYNNLEQYSVKKLKEILDYCKRHKMSKHKMDLINQLRDCMNECNDKEKKCKLSGLDYNNLENWTEKELEEALKLCENKNKPKLINDILDCVDGCDKCKMIGIDYEKLEQYSVKKLKEILDLCHLKNGDKYKNDLIQELKDCLKDCKGGCKIKGENYLHLENLSILKLKELLQHCKNNKKKTLIQLIKDCNNKCNGNCKDITIDYDNLNSYTEKELQEILAKCQDLIKPDLINDIQDCLKDSNGKCLNKTIDYDNLNDYTVEQLNIIKQDCEKGLKPILLDEVKNCLKGCDDCKNMTINKGCCLTGKCQNKKVNKYDINRYSVSDLKLILEKCKKNSNYELVKQLNDFTPNFANMTPEQKMQFKTSRLVALSKINTSNNYVNTSISKIIDNPKIALEEKLAKEKEFAEQNKQKDLAPDFYIKPGSSFYGVLLNNINTTIANNIAIIEFKYGKLKGFKGIGIASATTDHEGVQIAINTLVTPAGDKIPSQAFAIDSNSYSAKFADEVDSKTLKIFALTSAGILLEAFGEAKAGVEASGGTQTVSDGVVTKTNPTADFNNLFAASVSTKVGGKVNEYIARELLNAQTEVKVNRGKSLIIIFY
jgi:hypothetical protein